MLHKNNVCGFRCQPIQTIVSFQHTFHAHLTRTNNHQTAQTKLQQACKAVLQQHDRDVAALCIETSTPGAVAPLPTPGAHYNAQTGYAKYILQDKTGRVSLKNFTLRQLEEWCLSIGEPIKRAVHLWRWMYADGGWVRCLADTYGRQNAVNPRFVEATGHAINTDGGLQLQGVARSKDGTRKLLFKLTGGEGKGSTIETVIIPVVREFGQKSRLTLCVSTQVGCAMNCQFCYTGRMGLLANLTTAQIVEQVVEARRFLDAEGDATPLTNLVYMGMGEPLNNLQAVMDSINIVCCPLGLHVSHNKITVSTVGLVDEMRRFVPQTRAQLALSLHATTDEVRDWIVPVNRRYPLDELVQVLRELFPLPPSKAEGPLAKKAQLLAATAAAAQAGNSSPSLQVQGPGVSDSASAATAAAPSNPSSSSPAAADSVDQGRLGSNYTSSTSIGADTGASSTRTASVEGSTQGDDSSCSCSSSSNDSSRLGRGGRNSRKALRTRMQEEGLLSASKATLLVEYIMLRGINDTLEDAHRLAQMMRGVACKINLIEFNPHEGTPFAPSLQRDVAAFKSVLVQAGHVCTVRSSRGDDEMAACGQLGGVDGGSANKAAGRLDLKAQQQQQQRLESEGYSDEGADVVVELVGQVQQDDLKPMRKMPTPPPLLEPPPRFREVLRLQQEERLQMQKAHA